MLDRKILILIGGLPGSGKSYLASALATELNAIHLSSDRIRQDIGKLGAYEKEDKDLVYTKLKEEVIKYTGRTNIIIVDTTFSKQQLRDEVIDIANTQKFEWFFILTTASDSVIQKRTSKKREDSEADYDVYKKIKSEYDLVTVEHLVLNTDDTLTAELINKALVYCNLI
ncbi:MAG: ATP-binding protein [Bacteroidia bacterium]|nr:ATP-binding protein [Bacteroidia bacterium]NNC84871.1 ATP-binding protein [Bacteroidia bacterium]NNM16415.1 ATP-binding protein [Bacteroidia bacterium]